MKCLAVLLPVLLFVSCGPNVDCNTVNIINYDIEQDPDNVLRYRLKMETSKPGGSLVVQFWDVVNPEGKQTVQLDSAVHFDQLLYGFSENSTHVIQVLQNELCENIFFVDTIKTGPVPIVKLRDKQMMKNTSEFKGFIAFHQAYTDSIHYHLIVNELGKLVWYQEFDKSVSTFSITPDKTLVALLSLDKIQEVNFEGDVLFELELGEKGFEHQMHHEIQKDNDGNYYGLTYRTKYLDPSDTAFYHVDSLKSDGILVMDQEGNQLMNWSLLDVEMPPREGFNKYMINDWSHGNSLWRAGDGEFLMSFKNLNQVWKVDTKENKVVWKLGQEGTLDVDPAAITTGQHAAYLNDLGQLVVFDNGSIKTKISRGLVFTIDEVNNKAEVVKQTDLPAFLYTFKRGNGQELANDWFLLNSSMTNTIAVVSSQTNKVIYELKLPSSTYRAEYLESLY